MFAFGLHIAVICKCAAGLNSIIILPWVREKLCVCILLYFDSLWCACPLVRLKVSSKKFVFLWALLKANYLSRSTSTNHVSYFIEIWINFVLRSVYFPAVRKLCAQFTCKAITKSREKFNWKSYESISACLRFRSCGTSFVEDVWRIFRPNHLRITSKISRPVFMFSKIFRSAVPVLSGSRLYGDHSATTF